MLNNLKKTIMKFKYIYILAFLTFAISSCKKDLGNYTYSPPSEPVVEGVEGKTFSALIGDSLIIKPDVSLEGADPLKDLQFEWSITIQEELRNDLYYGYPLKMVYNLGPGERTAKLSVIDKRNGLKYNYNFKVTGTTQFSVGKLVLSNDNGVGKLSFVKPDDVTVLADLYQALQGEPLPSNPVQLYYSKPLPYQVLTREEFWVLSNDPAKESVILDASTLLRKNYLSSQFFTPPVSIVPAYLEPILGYQQMGTVPVGVINGKLYKGIESTAPFAEDYGKFANEQSGDYNLAPFFLHASSFYLGFNTKNKSFVTFSGDGSYTGTSYGLDATGTAFNPKNTGMDLLYMKPRDGARSYAYMKAADGSIQEVSFVYPTTDRNFNAESKRPFKGADKVKTNTIWQRNSLNVIYFSSNDKIYRYNPINEEITDTNADFGGKTVTMMKISDDDNTLTVGVEGAVHTVDISVNRTKIITHTINGIPGSPVDIIIRK